MAENERALGDTSEPELSEEELAAGSDDGLPIPAHLLEYHAREQRLRLPSQSEPKRVASAVPSLEDSALREVLDYLLARTGRDFSHHKRSTIARRVARRMQLNGVDDLPAYLSFLRTVPWESNALLQDLLSSVTSFFRDRECFQALEAHIPNLFENRADADTIRVWVPACATGEEAYSIAMLLDEHARTLESPPALQIFATDLNEAVLSEARNGFYPFSISTDVSSERLQRFFVKEDHGYRVRRALREKLLFAAHDLLSDSPFSRLDLISCRNLLIYFNRAAQERAFDIFHFALGPEGCLFLGSSESAENHPHRFRTIDTNHRLYASQPIAPTRSRLPSDLNWKRALTANSLGDVGPGVPGPLIESAPTATRGANHERLSLRDVHLRLMDRFGPASFLVNGDQVVHLSESASPFLHFSHGEPSTNVFRLVHPTVRAALRAAVINTRRTGEPSIELAVPTMRGNERRVVDIRVSPALDSAPDLLLVTLDEHPPAERSAAEAQQPSSYPAPAHLERELEQTKRQLRELAEQHEATAEDAKATNEELRAVNQQLRSATEELALGREELQSINRELTSVNQELKSKVDELGRTNSDLHNLIGATAIPTVFLDRALHIMRFTPPAVELFSLIPADVGRPLADLRHSLLYPDLLRDAAQVLQQLMPVEREVGAVAGGYFMARLSPYCTIDGCVAGVVLTLVDVTERHLAEQAVQRANSELESRVQRRTAQLDEVNRTLQMELIKQQEAELIRQGLQRRLINAQEEERRRVSRELHDEVGQQIVAMMLSLKALESTALPTDAAGKLSALRESAELLGTQIHHLASQLRPAALDALGLSQALATFLDSWAARSGIAVDFFSGGVDEPRLSSVLEITLYRIIQEATNNVVRHSGAHTVSVSIERRQGQVIAIVEDDGKGFDFETFCASRHGRLGIAGMQERAAIVDGELTIDSSPAGTTVRAKLPVASL